MRYDANEVIGILFPLVTVALIIITATRERLVGRRWLLLFFSGGLAVTLANIVGSLIMARKIISVETYYTWISPFISLLNLSFYCCLIPYLFRASAERYQVLPAIKNQKEASGLSIDSNSCPERAEALLPQHPLSAGRPLNLELYVKPGTAGLWIMIVILGGLLCLPVKIDRELAKSIGMGLIVGMAFSITTLVRYSKLKKKPYLLIDAQNIHCLPFFGKAWEVPLGQVSLVEMNDKVLTIQRGLGGKKYVVAVRPLAAEDRAALAAWVEEWKTKRKEQPINTKEHCR